MHSSLGHRTRPCLREKRKGKKGKKRESDFRRWVMRNFHELKEHVLNQCKETKNLEKRFKEITRMDN